MCDHSTSKWKWNKVKFKVILWQDDFNMIKLWSACVQTLDFHMCFSLPCTLYVLCASLGGSLSSSHDLVGVVFHILHVCVVCKELRFWELCLCDCYGNWLCFGIFFVSHSSPLFGAVCSEWCLVVHLPSIGFDFYSFISNAILLVLFDHDLQEEEKEVNEFVRGAYFVKDLTDHKQGSYMWYVIHMYGSCMYGVCMVVRVNQATYVYLLESRIVISISVYRTCAK